MHFFYSMPRLLIAASGTGGHIFPALAVADALPESWSVYWLGVPDRLEKELIGGRYEMLTFQIGGLQGSRLKKIYQLFRLFLASFKVLKIIRRENIGIVFTTGGYISAPAILGAKFAKIPVVIHESNAIPGKATRFLGRFCEKVALGLPDAIEYLPNCKCIITGTPVRKEFYVSQNLPSWIPEGDGPLILIMGGSQGAVNLNKMVRNILPKLLESNLRIVHLTGKNDKNFNQRHRQVKYKNLVEKEFSLEISALLQHSDLVISRAGASAISELAISGSPAILIPFPEASDNHQYLNAAYVAGAGAAVVVNQDENNSEILKESIFYLLGGEINFKESNYLFIMKSNMLKIAVRNPEYKLLELLEYHVK